MYEECSCGMHHRSQTCICGHHERGFRRHFYTKTEKVEKLKHYAEELRNELKAVEEHIKEFEAKKRQSS
jgi:predicted transcriptional regulator